MTANPSAGIQKLVVKPGAPLMGVVNANSRARIPGDKSLSHRAALLGAMAVGESKIGNFLVSGVTEAMLNALIALKIDFQLEGSTLRIQGAGLGDRAGRKPIVLQCGNSATTLRLLAGALAAWGQSSVLDGSEGLRRRPMNRIIHPLREMGVQIVGMDGCAPLTIQGSPHPLHSIQHILPVASAQVKSCLLLGALAADGTSMLTEPGPSRDHTERMLRSMGVQVESGQNATGSAYWTRLYPPQNLQLKPLEMILPGDMSAASFLITAALITPDSQVRLDGIGLNPTRTGLLDAFWEMGANITIENKTEQAGEPVGDIIVRSSQLHGIRVGGERVVRMIDEFPAFAVAASLAVGETLVHDAQELRNKESDRIDSLGKELNALGARFESKPDGFVIQGRSCLDGGVVDPHGDHRLAMSLALVGLSARQPVEVLNAGIIAESFPAFPSVLEMLGAQIQVTARQETEN